ncbi:glycosyltransferase involved in cell wall biosynthesis [Azospirillum fermentarium]|uniref:glycosyltransferase n=1 Tax=Azospirillum fermentarium TaxID=1233114 RepID=UPI0022272458|nr:glycosyltransferase [Azospirillum fermentarium]MCW2249483.1 glycosyltransferase involved in cell wall biosynthesis [Azospirillum fermentarium]
MIVFSCNFQNTIIAGGVRTLYKHAELLEDMGLETLVITPSGPPLNFKTRAKVFSNGNLVLPANARIIFPEVVSEDDGLTRTLLSYKVDRRVFVQNHFYCFHGSKVVARHRELGIAGVYAASNVISRNLWDIFQIDAPVVPYCIDHELFKPAEKVQQIAYMPRKLPADATYLKDAFAAAYPAFASIPWIPIEGCNEEQVAAILGRSTVFVSFSYREGFGLPPLEAMAAECLVVGFHGSGGMEYATEANGFWYSYDELPNAVHGLATAVRLAEQQTALYSRMIATGRQTVAQYDLASLKTALWNYFSKA